jgi:hypothetical protein
MKVNNVLQAEIHINKYSVDIIEEYEIDEKTDWLKKIVIELEEENDDDFEREEAKLKIKAQITKKHDKFLGDHLIIKSNVSGYYHLPCGRCLAPIKQDIDLQIDGAFLHESQEKMPEYQDVTTVFADGKEMELYFYRKGMVTVRDFYHEQLFSEVTPFPRCEGECKGQIYF